MDWSHGSNQDPEEREPMRPTPDTVIFETGLSANNIS
jgi:hypothetical protein